MTPPPGWKLVPIEPTAEMIAAAAGALGAWRKTLTRDEAMMRSYRHHDRKFIAAATTEEKHAIRWAAMLAKAPQPEPRVVDLTPLAAWMTAQGFATGHGDNLADMVRELEAQYAARYLVMLAKAPQP